MVCALIRRPCEFQIFSAEILLGNSAPCNWEWQEPESQKPTVQNKVGGWAGQLDPREVIGAKIDGTPGRKPQT